MDGAAKQRDPVEIVAVLAIVIGALALPWTSSLGGLISSTPAIPAEDFVARTALGGLCAAIILGAVFRNWRTSALVAGGVFLGLLGFVSIFGLRIVDPRDVAWALHPGDRQGHYLSFEYFRREPWSMPPGRMRSMHYPVGTSVGISDALPLLAIPIKLFNPWLPVKFQFMGAWLLVCVMLQGAFAALLVRQVGGNWVYQLFGVALFLFNPVAEPQLDRVAMATARPMTMAALWLYVRPAGSARGDLLAWSAICAMTGLSHPYACMMVAPLAAAYYLRRWRPDRALPFATVAACGAVLLGVLFACWWWSGDFLVGRASDLGGSGFGRWSMNILSPITPMWFKHLLPDQPTATDGQDAGFHYFGLGLILLTAAAFLLLLVRRPRRSTIVHFAPLFLACLLLTILALSPTVTFGSHVVVEMPRFLYAPFALFRSSGRLFTPVVWVIIFVVLRAFASRLPPLVALAVLVSGLTFQWADIAIILENQAARVRFGEPFHQWNGSVRAEELAFAGPQRRHLFLVPSDGWHEEERIDLMVAAADAGLTVNDGFAARLDIPRAYASNLETNRIFANGPLANDAIYAMHAADGEGFRERHRAECREAGAFVFCVAAPAAGEDPR